LIDEGNESILNLRSNLLAVANTYGLVIVGHSKGFKVINLYAIGIGAVICD